MPGMNPPPYVSDEPEPGRLLEEVSMKRVLMIAYHFPPMHGSSGVHRTLKFSQYLPGHGWYPLILTVHPSAYERCDSGQMDDVTCHTVVKRTRALDAARHLAIGGKHPAFFALPDRWVSWYVTALPAGLALIRKYRPQLLWTTYPIATAHLIGLTLHRLTGIPWIADFRDAMTDRLYPSEPARRRVFGWLERHTVHSCTRCVFTAPGALRMYSERYPTVSAAKWTVIENAYDEEDFAVVADGAVPGKARGSAPVVLLHSGTLYPSERDPRAFFSALMELKKTGVMTPRTLQVVFRATGYDKYYQKLISAYGLQDMVCLEPLLPYRSAVQELFSADGLLLFQASRCNHQIPAKLYEYLRVQRPILALTDPVGDTAAALRRAGVTTIVPPHSQEAIQRELPRFVQRVQCGAAPVATREACTAHARRARAAELAALLDAAVA
jgi:hypothetical protein